MTRRRRAEEMAAVLEKARELSREERVPDWTEEEWRTLMTAAVSQEPGRRPARRAAFPRLLFAYGSAALLLVAAVGLALRLRIFRTGPLSPVQAPAQVLAQKSEASPSPSREARLREKETVLAEATPSPRETDALVVGGIMPPPGAQFGAKDAAGPSAEAPQDTVTVRLVSPESGLRIVWILDKDFNWEGETR